MSSSQKYPNDFDLQNKVKLGQSALFHTLKLKINAEVVIILAIGDAIQDGASIWQNVGTELLSAQMI